MSLEVSRFASHSFRTGGVKVEADEVKQEVRGVFGRLGKQEETVKEEGEGRIRKEQEARVTSTSEEKTHEELRSARASASPGRGIFY